MNKRRRKRRKKGKKKEKKEGWEERGIDEESET